MKKAIVLLIGSVIATVGLAWLFLGISQGQAKAVGNVAAAEIASMEARILASTVQIELFDYGRIEGGVRQIRTSQGFGTVVQSEGQRFILTHNHWSVRASELNRVEIRNGLGQNLLVLAGSVFNSLVRYNDGGTMLLEAPPELAGVNAAELGDATALDIGSTVWLATYNAAASQGIEIETAWVREVDGTAVPGRLLLEGQGAAINSGTSGGGVWVDGKLVGNLWTIQVGEGGLGLSQQRPTGFIVAGIQPIPGAIGLTAADLIRDSDGITDYERGLEG